MINMFCSSSSYDYYSFLVHYLNKTNKEKENDQRYDIVLEKLLISNKLVFIFLAPTNDFYLFRSPVFFSRIWSLQTIDRCAFIPINMSFSTR